MQEPIFPSIKRSLENLIEDEGRQSRLSPPEKSEVTHFGFFICLGNPPGGN